MNPEVQALLACEINAESFLGKILECLDLAKYSDAILIQLLSGILNVEPVRRMVYRKRKLTSFVSRLTSVISKTDWAIAEAILRVFATLTCYSDTIDELVDATTVADLIEILAENDPVWESPDLEIFVKSLKSPPGG
jgi:hypothetical protein